MKIKKRSSFFKILTRRRPLPPPSLVWRVKMGWTSSKKCEFVIFKKTLGIAERGAKKLCRTDLATNLHQNCMLQNVFLTAFFVLHHFSYFFQNVLPAKVGSTISKNDVGYFRSKNHFVDPQTASNELLFANVRSVARSVRYVFAPCPLQK